MEEMEDGAAKKTGSCSNEKDNYRPSWYFMRIGELLMQKIKVVLIVIYLLFQMLNLFFQLTEPSTV